MEKDLLRVAISLLIKNAMEAMPENGTLTIETGREEEEIFLRISDTGSGIPANLLENIFVPFFSTKKRGFGLGLPLVKQIISEHLGIISVKSEEGKGTTFSLTFPSRWKDG
jgi:signal transduction histidine kinase